MIRHSLAFCLLLISFSTLSQVSIADFGYYPEDQVKYTSCSFDPDANAVVLFDVVKADHDDMYQLIQKRHVRIKVLNDKGIDEGNITIPYYHKNGFEIIKDIRGSVYTVDANGELNIKELQRKDIFNNKIDDKVGEIKFALPNVKAGSIIEYTYTSLCKNYNGLRDWLFQREIPTLLSSISVVILPGTEFSYVVKKKSYLPLDVRQDKSTGSIHFTMTNIAGLRNEPYMEAARDYLQQVKFQLSSYTSYGQK